MDGLLVDRDGARVPLLLGAETRALIEDVHKLRNPEVHGAGQPGSSPPKAAAAPLEARKVALDRDKREEAAIREMASKAPTGPAEKGSWVARVGRCCRPAV